MLPEIAVIVLVLLALVQCVLLVLAWRHVRQLQQQADVLRHDLAALSRQVSNVGHTDIPTSMLVTALGRMERRIALFEQQQAAPSHNLTAYELAQQLARDGASVDQLVTRCGLTQAEAVLIRQMHAAEH